MCKCKNYTYHGMPNTVKHPTKKSQVESVSRDCCWVVCAVPVVTVHSAKVMHIFPLSARCCQYFSASFLLGVTSNSQPQTGTYTIGAQKTNFLFVSPCCALYVVLVVCFACFSFHFDHGLAKPAAFEGIPCSLRQL